LKRAEKKKKKNPGINPRQPAREGRKKNKKKKTLVLTLGSPLEKGGEKKKTLVLTLGRSGAYTANPPEKGEKKKKKKKQPWAAHRKGRKKYLVGACDLRTL
jgi:hypothetical protein